MIADDTRVSGRRFWPWVEQPYKLWSLLEMLRFGAVPFIHALLSVEHAVGLIEVESLMLGQRSPDALQELRDAAARVKASLEELPFSPSLKHQAMTMVQVLQAGADHQVLRVLVNSIHAGVLKEIGANLFLIIEPDRRQLFESPEIFFGQDICDAFPGSVFDLKASGRCFALGEWTACVFHLMRAAEGALHKWAGQLGAVLKMPLQEANWQEILTAADGKLRELGQLQRTQQRTADLEYFGQTAQEFRSIKDAWRNHVSHGKRTYDEQEASDVMRNVQTFMNTLMGRP